MKVVIVLLLLLMSPMAVIRAADTQGPDLKGISEYLILPMVTPDTQAKQVGFSEGTIQPIIDAAILKLSPKVKAVPPGGSFKTKNGVMVIVSVEIGSPPPNSELRPFRASVKVFEQASLAREGPRDVVVYETWVMGITVGKDYKAMIDATAVALVDFVQKVNADN